MPRGDKVLNDLRLPQILALRAEGLKQREIAERIGCVQSFVSTALRRAAAANSGVRCLFCLGPCGRKGENANERRGAGLAGGSILWKYLLDTRNKKNEGLLQDICKILEDSRQNGDGGDLSGIGACDKCEEEAHQIWTLHQALEKIQMEMVQRLKHFRGRILHHFGDGSSGEERGKILEALVPAKEESGATEMEQRKLLEAIADFQRAVHEKGKQSVDVPCVILQKFAYAPRPQVSKDASIPENFQATVKREPVGDIDNCNGDTDFDAFCLHKDNLDMSECPGNFEHDNSGDLSRVNPRGTSPVPTLKLKGERDPTPTPHGASLECKLEVGEIPPKRRRRSASSKARYLIAKTPWGDQEPRNPPPGRRPPKKYKKRVDPKYKQRIREKLRFVLTCGLCSFSNKTTFLFERHLLSHEAECRENSDQPAEYRCDRCSKSFFCQELYTFHMEGHEGKVCITCDCCNVRIPYPEIEGHVKSHTDKIFSCAKCTFCCTTREKYMFHLRYHGTGRLKCDLCGKPHYSRDKLLEHLYTAHQEGVKYVCEVENCPKEFFIKQQLVTHRKIHTNPHVCPDCGKAYVDAWKLKFHRRTHTKEMSYFCSDCGAGFHVVSSLQRHRILEHGVDKFKCEYCDKEYIDGAGLKAHRSVHDGTGIPCGKCDKVFHTKTRWRRHQSVHSTERSFICEECGKGFTSQQTLRHHARTHGGEKKYKCQFCEKTFLFSKYLVNHERIHTGERPYTCEICGQSFNQRGSLTIHRKKAHPDHGVAAKEENTRVALLPRRDPTVGSSSEEEDQYMPLLAKTETEDPLSI